MENNQTPIFLNEESRALSIKVYQDNAARLTKQLKTLASKKEKITRQQETIEKELAGINSLIAQVSGEKIAPPVTATVENSAPIQEIPYASPIDRKPVPLPKFSPPPGMEIDTLGIDPSGYNVNFLLEEKIDYVLKNAPRALKSRQIIHVLRGFDDKYKSINDEGILKTINPYLSNMSTAKKILKGTDNSQGYYYIHPSWAEDGKIKQEFKDRIPENLIIF